MRRVCSPLAVQAQVPALAADEEAGVRLDVDVLLRDGHGAVLDVGRVGAVVGVAGGDRHPLLAVADVHQLDEVGGRHELSHHGQPVLEGEEVNFQVAFSLPQITLNFIKIPETISMTEHSRYTQNDKVIR